MISRSAIVSYSFLIISSLCMHVTEKIVAEFIICTIQGLKKTASFIVWPIIIAKTGETNKIAIFHISHMFSLNYI